MMRAMCIRNRGRSCALAVALLLAPLLACADEPGMRLSEWLAARPASADDYPAGLLWQVPEEEAAQAGLRAALLQRLDAAGNPGAGRLRAWLSGLPVTGRVPVSIVDPDWLSANLRHNPVVRPGQRISLPQRPRTVELILSNGRHYRVAHRSGAHAPDYLAAATGLAGDVDWVWVVQPDGLVKRFGVAGWNRQKQDEPAPGAWLWAPLRSDAWAVELGDDMAEFLATQGVASGADGATEMGSDSNGALAADPVRDADLFISANDWGVIGLLQTPTARMRPAGYGAMTLSRTMPYSRTNVFLQPLEWLEFGFRYTSVSDRYYGVAIAGDQSYKDKSMSLKLKLNDESAYVPQVAVGLLDMTGTGLFAGEYVVASKRTGQWDWSLGLGWGYVGARGDVSNPLAKLSPAFNTRVKPVVGTGGNFSWSTYFRGPAALFGGMQYHTRWEPLSLKLEYEGNNYRHEPFHNPAQSSPWNVGAVYRAGRALDVTLGYERGNLLTLSLTLQTDMARLATPKLDDPAPVPVSEFAPAKNALGQATALDLERQSGWSVRRIVQEGDRVRVDIDGAKASYWRESLDRAGAVLHRDAPAEVKSFVFAHSQSGVPLADLTVDRAGWVARQTEPLPPAQQADTVVIRQPAAASQSAATVYQAEPARFQFEPGMGLKYNLGGPDGFILYQIFAEGTARWKLRDDTWLQGGVQLRFLDNYDKFRYTQGSLLPHVRTYLREYMTSTRLTLPNLQFTHVGKLAANQYYSVYGGFLESMFAGAGGEWMYRAPGSSVALGIDWNRVRQRDFRQDSGLMDYRVNTGHATLYWDTGWNDVLATLSAGRYLAGDRGVTVDMARTFPNGVRFGGYFTKTNVTAVQFGEGSFDKGIYVAIPFDAMMTKTSGKMATLVWQPLLRDGGARLDRAVRLYDMTRLLDERELQYRPAELDNNIPIPSQRPLQWGVSAPQ